MKKFIAPLFCAILLISGVAAADAGSQRFYGKVVSVDAAKRSVTVHNAKQKLDASFLWDEKTGIIQNKKEIRGSDLKVGQSLIVSFDAGGDAGSARRATRITVRTPFKKASADN